MPWKLAACVCLIALMPVACQPDSPSIIEVEGTLDHHPERPSCRFAPEAITTVEGEDEVVLIEFTYGGGATWGGEGHDCGEDPGPNLGGVLLAADGVSYGDSVGADGDFITLQACETVDPQLADCAYNMPSPRNSIRIDALLGYTGYLTFDPPISNLSLRVCSNQSHALAAWDSIGNLIVPDTVGPSNGSYLGGDLYCDPEDWEEFRIEASGYDISRVRLRRFDPGLTAWDDMRFRRAAQPGIECTEDGTGEPEVTRGNVVVCSIIDTTGVQSVSEWRFEGENDEGTPLTPIVNTSHDSVVWSGIAVAAGEVSATLVRDGNEEVVTGSLNIESREWRWSEDDPNGAQERVYTQGSGQECVAWTEGIVDQQGNPIGTIVYAQNTTKAGFGDCGTGYLMPDPTGQDGYEVASIQDLGPNDGVYYVTSGSWHMRRGSLINPFFLENGTAKELKKKPDQKACEGLTAIVDWASFWEFNELCQGSSLSTFLQGLWDHEGVGSLGPGAAEPNGHWGRVDSRAKEPAGDPYRAMEDVVDENLAALRARVEDKVRDVQDALAVAADGQFHLHVRNNFCGLVFMYNGIHGRYDFVQPLQTGGFCI